MSDKNTQEYLEDMWQSFQESDANERELIIRTSGKRF